MSVENGRFSQNVGESDPEKALSASFWLTDDHESPAELLIDPEPSSGQPVVDRPHGPKSFCWLVWIKAILDRARFMDRGHFAILWIEVILPAAMDRGHFDLLWIKVILTVMSAPILQRSPPAAGDVVNGAVTFTDR